MPSGSRAMYDYRQRNRNVSLTPRRDVPFVRIADMPKTISFTSTVFPARTVAGSSMPSASRTTVSMSRNLFIITFLFQFPARFKSEEEPGIINQIYRNQHSHHTHQQINLQHPSRHPPAAAFGHINHQCTENKEEKRNQRITPDNSPLTLPDLRNLS